MRTHLTLALALLAGATTAQEFNFYGTEYFLASEPTGSPGATLTASGTSLASFNYNSAPPQHPLFTAGVYYPVLDCAGKNLWVRVQHIAHDPNGTMNGFNVTGTLNSPFLPLGSTDRIGGWFGFLYEFRIIADQALTGARTNILGNLFPTNITVASLETLYNNGADLYEWLSFEILDASSTGWSLNSINFTGINPGSNPGFSAELNYSTTATVSTPPTGFSTTFPTGSPTVYAIDLNLSGAEHSEFRMTAGGVSRFRYGYEFDPGGYQGMSIAFGTGAVLNTLANDPQCAGDGNGSITITPTGEGPFTYAWSSGGSGMTESGLAAGQYTVTVTDGNGCVSQQSVVLNDPEPLEGTIFETDDNGTVLLQANVSGGTEPYTYSWSNGSTEMTTQPGWSGSYSVTVTDGNGCEIVLDYTYVGIHEQGAAQVMIYPNPCSGQLTVDGGVAGGRFRLFDAGGRLVLDQWITAGGRTVVDVSDLSPGPYICDHLGTQRIVVLEPR
ncbi:MAG: hypothetical protein KIT10_13975 [Flavobacteriales bacterium]|nr:hypothetical protein [Flavobacteriales bacterium]